MKKVGCFVVVLMQTLFVNHAALVELPRTCDLLTCNQFQVQVPPQPTRFSCVALGEVIVDAEVSTTACGAQNELIPNENKTLCEDMALNLISEKCFGEEECEVLLDSINCNGPLSVEIKCEETLDVFLMLAYGISIVVGLGLGSTIELDQLKEVFKSKKRALLIGFISQFVFMPLIAFILAISFQFEPLVAIGVVITGCCPGGSFSNLLTYFAKGDVALSMAMTAVSVFAALFMMPLCVYVYGNVGLDLDGVAGVPFTDILIALSFAVIPSLIGIMLRKYSEKGAKVAEVCGGTIGFIMIVAILVQGILANPELLQASTLQKSWIAASLFFPTGASIGYFLAWVSGVNFPSQRAVCLETGFQNVGIAIALISTTFQGCERNAALTFPLIAGFLGWCYGSAFTIFLRFVLAPCDPVEEKQVIQESTSSSEDNIVDKDTTDITQV